MGKTNCLFCICFNLLFLGILLLFASCATTVPAPKSNEDTLLIINSKTEAETGTTFDFPWNIEMKIKKGGEFRDIYINPLKPYTSVSGLKPGDYVLTEYKVVSTDYIYKASIPFTIKPGKLHVAPFVVLVTFYEKDNLVYYRIKLEELDFKGKKEIIDDLKKNKNIDLWEIEYTVPET